MKQNDSLDYLENEAIYVLREVKALFKNPYILFSGGKDSLCILHLARKAFHPDEFPFPVLHIDTGHNFEETLVFRDKVIGALGAKLYVRKVENTIRAGRASEETGPYPSRNRQQAVTLMDAIKELHIDCAIGGARRDEEKARSKERFFSVRKIGGAWEPSNQRAELWNLYNHHLMSGEHMRAFPLNNWTERDVWRYILREKLEVPSIYFSHRRKCVFRSNGTILPLSPYITPESRDRIEECQVRFRTVGDMTCTSPVFSDASSVELILQEISSTKISERGSRADDKFSDTAMEDRKKEGYF
jgi:sulfate adenylyltransferase subunit 2